MRKISFILNIKKSEKKLRTLIVYSQQNEYSNVIVPVHISEKKDERENER